MKLLETSLMARLGLMLLIATVIGTLVSLATNSWVPMGAIIFGGFVAVGLDEARRAGRRK